MRQVNILCIGKHLVGVMLFVLLFSWGASAVNATTLVFVHGKGSGKNPVDQVTNEYWTTDMIRAATRNYQAKYLVVTYDGTQYYWDVAADVANQVNTFLNSNPSERLVFVTHSYGGVLTRWIMCNSAPTSPYYNYGGANYARIANATNYVISLGAPNGGSEAADVGSTLSSSLFTSWIVSLLNQNNNSTKVLTTSNMAHANQNWLRDNLRTKAIYTVAGTDTLNHFWHLNDVGLNAIDGLVSFRTETDGLVATWSAHLTGGPGYDWVTTTANHDHLSHNDDPGYIGDIIGQYGW